MKHDARGEGRGGGAIAASHFPTRRDTISERNSLFERGTAITTNREYRPPIATNPLFLPLFPPFFTIFYREVPLEIPSIRILLVFVRLDIRFPRFRLLLFPYTRRIIVEILDRDLAFRNPPPSIASRKRVEKLSIEGCSKIRRHEERIREETRARPIEDHRPFIKYPQLIRLRAIRERDAGGL